MKIQDSHKSKDAAREILLCALAGAIVIIAFLVFDRQISLAGRRAVVIAEGISLISLMAGSLAFFHFRYRRHRGDRENEKSQLTLQYTALEAAANAIVIVNRSGTIEWVNEAFGRLTGYSREDVIGKSPRILKSGLHDRGFYENMWRTVLADKVWTGILTNRRKDGSIYYEETTITPVHARGNGISHFISIKQDITERKKLEEQFFRAQRMESIGLLAGGIAHDINNVLAPVLLALPMLRENPTEAERDELISTIEHSVRRGAGIVQQVLTFARGGTEKRAPVQLRHLIKEVAKTAEETFPRNISIEVRTASDLRAFQGDPTQIHQVLLNFALNARDALPDGGKITFSADNVELSAAHRFLNTEIPAGKYIRFSVADTGTGITPETVDHIFEPFFTTKPPGKGSGLGLSTVLGIVKGHRGMVEVESKPGAGSKFTVHLVAAGSDEPASVDMSPPPSPIKRKKTILIVDDESCILDMLDSILSANGYGVVQARNGREARDVFVENASHVDAILTDIMMPLMDGVAFVEFVREINPTLPIVVATGLINPIGERDRTSDLKSLNVQHILQKPFHAAELLNVLGVAVT